MTSNYLGSGQNITAGPSTAGLTGVGRFIPHHFDTAVLLHGCPDIVTPANSFTYSGQPFSVTVTAENAAGGTTTNYDGPTHGFDKAVTISNAGSSTNFGNNSIAAGSFASGIRNQNNVTYTYPVASKETVPVTLALRAEEDTPPGDGVTSDAVGTEASAPLRSGRLRIINGHGSELAAISLPMRVEFFSTDGWVTNDLDACTTLDSSILDLENAVHNPSLGANIINIKVLPDFPSTVTVVSPAAGVGALNFTAPLVEGYADAGMSLTARTWLRFDWDSDGATEEDPLGRATFGLYRGSPRHIYQRERY
jgi:MSHA biogenesis protein MshQ